MNQIHYKEHDFCQVGITNFLAAQFVLVVSGNNGNTCLKFHTLQI